jgi:HK97 family phage prohead protease
MLLEIKGSSLEIKDLQSSKREVAFYFSNFDSIDAHNHIIQKGAFSKSAQEGIGRIKHFRNHNDNENFGKILSIQEDEKGAFVVSKVKRGAQGDQMIMDYEDGIITEHSFGAYPIKQQKREDGVIVKTEYKLMEVSSLDAWGANKNTPLISIKSMANNEQELELFFQSLKDCQLEKKEYLNLKAKLADMISYINSLEKDEPLQNTQLVQAEDVINSIKSFKFI